MLVDIHADDYGYSLNTSKDILDCVKKGALTSFSIISNNNDFDRCVDLLYKEIPNFPYLPLMSVHISLPEGKGEILPISWAKLFLFSYSFSRNEYKNKLKKEIKKQIDDVSIVVNKCIEIAKKNNIKYSQKALRIDTHVHSHPIPIVWDALKEVLEEGNYDIEYIRNPKEPIIPFIKHIELIKSYGLVNMIKNRILMLYSRKIDKYCERYNLPKMYMWGLMMSGCMDFDRIEVLYDDVYNYALKHNRNLELLFHPGRASIDEYSKEMDPSYFRDANLSINRNIEKESVLKMKENGYGKN